MEDNVLFLEDYTNKVKHKRTEKEKLIDIINEEIIRLNIFAKENEKIIEKFNNKKAEKLLKKTLLTRIKLINQLRKIKEEVKKEGL